MKPVTTHGPAVPLRRDDIATPGELPPPAAAACLRWLAWSLLVLAEAGRAATCTSATPACAERVAVGRETTHTLVYRNHPLEARNERISRAVIVVHGQGRDAGNYFRHGLAAGFLAGALEHTIIISPRFASNEGGTCRDTLAPGELSWVCFGPASWRNGGGALDSAHITSYDVADEILWRLARKDIFPNLKSIMVIGHSAGGQFATRYAMANQLHDRLGIPVAYVVANPSSYTYPDSLRPTASAVPANVAAAPPGYVPPPAAKPPAPFVPFADARNCTGFDGWPYGLQNRTGYSAKFPDEQLKKQLAARATTYLLGELDILPLYGFDSSCAAMAQGPTRLARGLAFGKHLNENYGAQHRTVVIPACGHSARCMFTADRALAVIFPKDPAPAEHEVPR